MPIGQVEACSQALAVALASSPVHGSLQSCLKSLLLAETLRGGASLEVGHRVRWLATCLRKAVAHARPEVVTAQKEQKAAGVVNQGGPGIGWSGWEDQDGLGSAGGELGEFSPNGREGLVHSAAGAAAYVSALVHIAKLRYRAPQVEWGECE
ncbi:unnamed protein product, partial [Discosporangium mesarthrocarpum]